MKKLIKILSLIILMAVVAIATVLLTGGVMDEETMKETVDKLIPIVLGIVTGLITTYTKTNALETAVSMKFDNVAKKTEQSAIESSILGGRL